MTEFRAQIEAALHTHRRQHETSMYCECGAWVADMDAHRADTVTRLVQPALDQLEELLAIAHETDSTAETDMLAVMPDADMRRVTALYERWLAAGPPPLGTLMSRWWDARLVELHEAIQPPDEQSARTTANNPATSSDTADNGPSVDECVADDRRWDVDREGE